MFNDDFCEEQLVKISGQAVLGNVTNISLVINTQTQSILSLGDKLTNLTTLILDNSLINSIRDLGTSIRLIETLSLNNCALNELDGICSLGTLKYLSVMDNQIGEVAPLALHENIRVWMHFLILAFICSTSN